MAKLEMNIGFVGGGQMARALASGFAQKQLIDAERLYVYDVSPEAAQGFAATCGGANLAESASDVGRECDIIFIAVKPQYMDDVLAAIGSSSDGKLVVSVAAGVRLSQIELALPEARVIRVMPNTPCLIGCGASAFSLGAKATSQDQAITTQLLESVGIASQVSEPLLDAITGLSGSGPAFVYLAIEALSDGGVQAGLPRDLATQFAAQTVLGAAQMVIQTGEHPAVLKDRVASPAGTTIAGIKKLEESAFRAGLINAVQAATERSRELGE